MKSIDLLTIKNGLNLLNRGLGFFVFYILCLCISPSAQASMTDIYVAQNAAGASTGADCVDAYAYTWFNNAANWTVNPTAGKIGPGTTVHVCGAIVVAANTTVFTFQGSGANGNPITLLFESGAYLQSPYFNSNGAIYSDGNNYITVNGGVPCGSNGVTCNGYVQNTLNGTAGGTCPGGTCTSNPSTGIWFISCSGCTIENMGVYDIYDRSSSGDESNGEQNNGCASIKNNGMNGATSFQLLNNTLHDCGAGFYGAYGTTDSGWALNGNKIYHNNWGIGINGQSTNNSLSNSTINSNEIYDSVTWNDGSFDNPPGPYNNHHNYIVIFSGNTGTSVSGITVCNNYGHGDFGSGTAVFDVQNSAATTDSVTFCNNYIDLSATTNTTGGDGGIYAENDDASGAVNFSVYNNTIIGANTMAGISAAESHITTIAENNIIQNWATPFWLFDSAPLPATMNFNDWYQSGGPGGNGIWDNNSNDYSALVSWQSATGFDENSVLSNPMLNSNGTPQSGSPVLTLGTNLTSLCSGNLAILCLDRAGNARPTSGAWTAGAYSTSVIQYGDINGAPNGLVTVYDAALVAQYVVGLITLTSAQLQAAMVSSSAETSPSIYDAFLIAEYAVGLITQFPVGQ